MANVRDLWPLAYDVSNCDLLDRDGILCSDSKVPEKNRIYLFNRWEVDAFVPEKVGNAQLAHDSHDVTGQVGNDDPMYTAAENFDGLCQVAACVQLHRRLAAEQWLQSAERYTLTLLRFGHDVVEERNLVSFRLRKADNNEQVGVQVAIVKGRGDAAGALGVSDEDDIGRAFEQKLGDVSTKITS